MKTVTNDFEKAFDSMNWNFLDHTMEQMGFSFKWRWWIRECLNNAFGSALIIGSPSKEFSFQKCLCQGDPLSPFLFIIAMEAFHVTLQDAKAKGRFEGIKVGTNSIVISHLQFADDALILGVTNPEINHFAAILCCQPSSLPCFYLGLPIGGNMNMVCHWKPIIEKFHKRLTS
nr:cysteine-rich receptor-like protein kinase [Tanacetum cinerariifolium]